MYVITVEERTNRVQQDVFDQLPLIDAESRQDDKGPSPLKYILEV